jgi:hypothetical protein
MNRKPLSNSSLASPGTTVPQAVVTLAANKTVHLTTELARVSSVDIAHLQLGRAATEKMDRPDKNRVRIPKV